MGVDMQGHGLGFWGRKPQTADPGATGDQTDSDGQRLVYNLLAFTQHMEAARAVVAKQFKLSGAQYTVFMAIARHEGKSGIDAIAVARLLEVTPAFITVEVNRLVAMGMIEKSVDTADKRRLRLRVSAWGKQHIERNGQLIYKMNELLFEGLDVAEFHQFATLVSKLMDRSERAVFVLKGICDHLPEEAS